jgi:ABC-2 type transport system ATP-binding protein
MNGSQDILTIDQVVKDYEKLRALDGVSFSVRPGEVFGLLGPNGAGKTSLISIIVSLERLTGGRVTVFGHDIERDPREAKLHVGWVPQEIINHGYFDVLEVMHFHSGYYGLKHPKERIEHLLHHLGLWEHRHKKVRQLSGGMKRRLMIAKALVHKPGLLLLDEPTAGVDVELRTKLWEFVEELRREGISILLTTHYLEEAERLCDRVAIINKGRIRACGETHKLIGEWSRKRLVLRLVRPVEHLTHPDLVQGSGDEWVFLAHMGKTVGELLQELKLPTENLRDIQVEEGNLEDVFRKLTSEKLAEARA